MCLFVIDKMFNDKTSGSSEMGETPAGTAWAEDPLGNVLSFRVS